MITEDLKAEEKHVCIDGECRRICDGCGLPYCIDNDDMATNTGYGDESLEWCGICSEGQK